MYIYYRLNTDVIKIKDKSDSFKSKYPIVVLDSCKMKLMQVHLDLFKI